ncbi:MAG: phosphoenolpyruvate synthase, partial [Desulfovibrio sp.]|nr:phosphoenolpyruvate synthase [Desulfovibrio sp.]
VGQRRAENYVSFVLRGGAADVERRILRVNFVGDILWEFGFQPDIRGDQLTARLEGMDLDEGEALLKVAGYLAIHTRQLDMIMQDRDQCAQKRAEILEHCRILYTGLK